MYVNKQQIQAIGEALERMYEYATRNRRFPMEDYYILEKGRFALVQIVDTYTKDCLRLADAQRKRRATPEGREHHNRLSRESARRRKKIVG